MDPFADEVSNNADLPPSLARALVEPTECTLRLRTGDVVQFTRADRHGMFITLYAASAPLEPASGGSMTTFPHGLEVRISDIVWCARGPTHGSPAAPPPPGVNLPVRIQPLVE